MIIVEKSRVSYRLGTNHPAVGTISMPWSYTDLKEVMGVVDRVIAEGYKASVYIRREIITEDKIYP